MNVKISYNVLYDILGLYIQNIAKNILTQSNFIGILLIYILALTILIFLWYNTVMTDSIEELLNT